MGFKTNVVVLFIFLVQGFLPRLNAQLTDSSFVRYTFKDGLSSNYITSLEQDDLGYIWVGTETGLNRFDGLNFKNYVRDNDFQFPSGSIRKLAKLEKGKMAILSNKGLHYLNTKDLSVQRFYIEDSSLLSTYRNAAWDVELLPDRSVAMSTATGFYVFDRNGTLKFRHDAFSEKDYGKRILYGRDILPVTKNELLIYTHLNGLAHYDIAKKTFVEASAVPAKWDIFWVEPPDPLAAHTSLVNISETEYLLIYLRRDSIGYYNHEKKLLVKSPLPNSPISEFSWLSRPVAINDSLFAVNPATGGFYTFILDRKTGMIRFDPVRYLKNHTINVLFIDREKRLWAGTRNGLLRQRINENFLKATYYPPAPGDLSVVGFQSSYRYKDKLYVTRYSRTNGLVVIDTATGKVVKRVAFYGGNNAWNEITSVIMYHPDTLWMGTPNGPLWLDIKTYRYGKLFDTEKFPQYPQASLHFYPVNKDGYAWFFFFMSGAAIRYHVTSRRMDLFDAKSYPAFPFTRVKSIAYDSYGDVWFGGHALARWNTKQQRFDTMMTVYGGVNKYYDNILTMTADNNGSLWLHNAENGLLEYRIREKSFVAYTTRDGLPTNLLQCFSPVVADVLWIGSANTLTRFNTRTKESFVYDHNDGFPDESPNVRRIFYDAERNNLYLFCKDYIVNFPAKITSRPKETGDLLIQEFRVNDKRSWYHPDEKLNLRHNENSINLHFNIIEFESPNSYQLSYKIDDEQDWTIAGSGRTIQLKGIPPGDHRIQIRAIGKNGEEKLKELEFSVGKPFWKTTGFQLAVGVLLAGLIIFFYRRRLNSIHQKADIDRQLAQTQMKALHAQMNPHFVFNSLNSIREMILNNESKEASHFLSKFAQLMRMTLDHSVRTFISLRTTMEYLERYMEMEQIRNERFTCRILADEELDRDEILLPPMLIQPFIENAIWHGVTDSKKDININIDFTSDHGQLVCTIDDNGRGIHRSLAEKESNMQTHTSRGINNIRNRIQLLNEKYGLACSLDIVDKSELLAEPCGPGQGTGTRVTIRLPLHIDE